MNNPNDYDPYELLPSPEPQAAVDILTTAIIPPGLHPSTDNTIGVPPSSTPTLEASIMDSEQHVSTDSNPVPFSENTNRPSVGSPTNGVFNEWQNKKLFMIAQPEQLYRARYLSEHKKNINVKGGALRFIQAAKESNRDYPTIGIPPIEFIQNRSLYIQVTLITEPSTEVPVTCIHPYKITTEEENALKDSNDDSIYFRINDNDFLPGGKSFRIILIKLKQDELKSHGPLRLLNSDQYDIPRVDNLQGGKQMIEIYQLKKHRFLFTIAERYGNNAFLTPIVGTSVKSDIMLDVIGKTNSSPNIPNGIPIPNDVIRCVPQKGDWQGGDEVLIVMSNPISGNAYNIFFDFGECRYIPANEKKDMDIKTISIRTPPCPLQLSYDYLGARRVPIQIIIQQNELTSTPIYFEYWTPIITNNICSSCQLFMPSLNMNGQVDSDVEFNFEFDSAAHLASEMSQLSIQQTKNESRPRTSSKTLSKESQSELDTYLDSLKSALAEFVRTNNPSRLFRLTRLLLAKCGESSPPLNDAIQRGHTQLALTLIEQVIKMPSANGLLEKGNEDDETPLLIAAKMNQWKLIQTILEKRSDLAQQKDKNGNNLLHLLASLSEDKDAETLKNVLEILPNDVKTKLMKEKNKSNETPVDIAQSHSNTESVNLLKLSIDAGQNNA